MSFSLRGVRASRSLAGLSLLVAIAACADSVPPTAPLAGPLGAASFSTATTANEYQFVAGQYSWTQARDRAAAAGGRLAIINSAAEQARIVALAYALQVPNNQYWLGATRTGGGAAYCGWTWIDGSPLGVDRASTCFNGGFSNWNEQSPSGDGASMSFLWYPVDPHQRGQWNDAPGYLGFGYIVEYNHAPVITLTTAGGSEGSAVPVSISAVDEDGGSPTITYSFGDGTTGSGALQGSHVYTQDGSYVVTVTATDGKATVTATQTVVITNVLPVVSMTTPPVTILVGETYAGAGTFTDPGADTWSVAADFGANAGTGAVTRSGNTFQLSHRYMDAGSYTVVVRVSDNSGGWGQASTVVTVLSPAQGVQTLSSIVTGLAASGAMPANSVAPLTSSLNAVQAAVERGNAHAAAGALGAFDNKLEALVKSGKITEAAAAAPQSMSTRVRSTLELDDM